MFKRILALLLWLGGAPVFAQSINNQSPAVIGVDGSNVTGAKVLVLPQIQSTVGVTPTPQTSAWFQMNGNSGALVEFSGNTFAGTYSVQVSNNPTPISTPGQNLYTEAQDTATYSSGGQGAQTKNWSYSISRGFRYIRFLCTPETGNTGTLNIQIRLFGNDVSPGDAEHTFTDGVPWKSREGLVGLGTIQATAVTEFYDYKLPKDASGASFYTVISGLGASTTLTTTVMQKDPTTGLLQSVGVGTVQTAAGLSTIVAHPGYASPFPVATPPAGFNYLSVALPQNIVIKDVVTGTGPVTFSQSAVPLL